MNKMTSIICDICRVVITTTPTREQRMGHVHICKNAPCIEKYQAIVKDELDKAKDSLSSPYYWRRIKEIDNMFKDEGE